MAYEEELSALDEEETFTMDEEPEDDLEGVEPEDPGDDEDGSDELEPEE